MKTSVFWQTKQIVEGLKFLCEMSTSVLINSRRDEKPKVRYSTPGHLSPNYARPICLFCSFDEKSVIRKNVYYYLSKLKLAGFDIIFISSSEMISDTDLRECSKLCIRIIIRENRGYDFYGWKIGLQEYPQYHLHSALLLANDSVLGPFFSIKNLIARLENNSADIIGMTDSLHFHPHLQSYFLYCKKTVINSEEFAQFFSKIEVLEFKMAIIRKYEVGFSQSFGRRFKLSALYSLEGILNHIHYDNRPKYWIDATTCLWKPLLTEFNFPFLKKKLLIKRGINIEEVSEILARSGSNYTVDMLAEYIVST
ncbi:rhamnan synthesis F family protein [Nitrosomonas sp. Nm34]|uniref:rhamnan synthesis F family protein n=1 Tax=Nitrosomonas sp. Nm34 TaxID=1881055 RepID=UPI0008EC7CED|nr:rhamnan synthesis F family protein [Nitrosomonas sp. Nm34]SFI47710.1 rhamnosyltransferase [Nitrosomonas sp. Nm34]